MEGVDRRNELRAGNLPTTIAPVQGQAALPVHSYFKREVGSLVRAQIHFGSYSQLPKPTSPAALRGARYEKKVLALLDKTFGNRVLPGPLFTFQDATKSRPHSAYPDALLFNKDFTSCCIIECKFRHTGDAWWQLNRFYLPIVRRALPAFRIHTCEIVAGYDPGQRLPQPVAFVNDVDEVFETRDVFHPVLVLSERELRGANDRCLA